MGGDYQFPLTGQWNGQVGADRRLRRATTEGASPTRPAALPASRLRRARPARRCEQNQQVNIGDSRGQTADLNIGLTRVSVIQPRTFAVSLSTTF